MPSLVPRPDCPVGVNVARGLFRMIHNHEDQAIFRSGTQDDAGVLRRHTDELSLIGTPVMMAKIIEPMAPIPGRVTDVDAEPLDRVHGSEGRGRDLANHGRDLGAVVGSHGTSRRPFRVFSGSCRRPADYETGPATIETVRARPNSRPSWDKAVASVRGRLVDSGGVAARIAARQPAAGGFGLSRACSGSWWHEPVRGDAGGL